MPVGVPRFNYVGKYVRTCVWCGREFRSVKPEAANCGDEQCLLAAKREYARRKQRRRKIAAAAKKEQ